MVSRSNPSDSSRSPSPAKTTVTSACRAAATASSRSAAGRYCRRRVPSTVNPGAKLTPRPCLAASARIASERGVNPGGVDVRAAAALVARGPGELTDHGDRPAAGQRQCAAVVLQQHGAVGGHLPRQGVLGVRVEPAGGAAVVGRPGGSGAAGVRRGGEAGQGEHAADGGVDHGLGQLTGPDGVDDPLCALAPGAGHLQVQPGGQRGHRVVHGTPVGDHRAGEAPFPAQDLGQQPLVLGRVHPVDLVIRAHHRGRLGLGDDPLEGGQVNLAQRPLVDLGADQHAVSFLVVHREVLDRCPDALALLALDVRGAEQAGQQRIF